LSSNRPGDLTRIVIVRIDRTQDSRHGDPSLVDLAEKPTDALVVSTRSLIYKEHV
jgi:hypothetical protein